MLEWYYGLEEITLDEITSFQFLMLKQMLENELSIRIVSWDSEDLYRASLNQCNLDNQEPLKTYMGSLEDFKEKYKEFWR